MQHQVTQARCLVPMSGDAQNAIGIRVDATACDLYDELVLRNQAIAGVVSVGLSAPLHELNATLLNGYLQAIQLLVGESSSLSERAYELLTATPKAP